jgi:hypothetical protein
MIPRLPDNHAGALHDFLKSNHKTVNSLSRGVQVSCFDFAALVNLESTKAPVDVIVIDKVSRPTEN